VPMFALAAASYFVLRPPAECFSLAQLGLVLTFLNGWSPGTLPTADHAWEVVPGGWSMAAEFGIYALFPILAYTVASLRRALVAWGVVLIVGGALDQLAIAFYEPSYGWRAADQFSYYWLPNQLPVFLCGFLVFFLLQHLREGHRFWRAAAVDLTARGGIVTGLAILMFLSIAYLPLARLPNIGHGVLPAHVVAAALFSAVTVALGLSPRTIWTNRFIVNLGRVSFSAYLLHFSIMDFLSKHLDLLFKTGSSGIEAIIRLGVFLPTVASITLAVSAATYAVVETPMIAAGQKLCEALARNRTFAQG
jgi:peptidoglycan/LPS O-acetylase OafA/YrhL